MAEDSCYRLPNQMAEDVIQPEWHETSESIDHGKHGKDYELEISKFLFKRLIDADFTDFKFTREKKGLGKFDDLTYIYVTENQEKKFCLIQSKHILDEDKKIDYEMLASNKTSYFFLPKYFDHYQDSLKAIKNDKAFLGATLESLIICTNIELSDNLGDIKKYKQDDAGLFTNCGVHYNLEIPNDIKRKIFYESYLSSRKKLANELTYTIMLGKRIDISLLEKDEHVSLIKTYHVALARDVIDVSSRKLKKEFLQADFTENSEVTSFQKCFLESVSEFCFTYQSFTEEELKNKLKLKIKTAKELKNRLTEYESSKSLVNFLKNQNISFGHSFGQSFIHLNEMSTLPMNEEIDANKIDQEIENFLSLLVLGTKVNTMERIIRQEMGSDMFLKFNDKMNNWYHKGSYKDQNDSTIKKRNWLTKMQLVYQALESPILFQGKKVILKNLLSDEHLISPSLLLNTFSSKVVKIGCPPSSLWNNEIFYINRILERNKIINLTALTKCLSDTFIISSSGSISSQILGSISSHEICAGLESYQKCSRVILCDYKVGEDDFQQFIKKHNFNLMKRNLHWLECDLDGRLLWKNSYGQLTQLRDYIDSENYEEVSESALEDNNFNIISGKPGMGKSTLLKNAAKIMFKSNERKLKHCWIIRIQLNSCPLFAENIRRYTSLENLLLLLGYFEEANDDISKNLLKTFLHMKGRMVLFFDGFEELKTDVQRKEIIKLLNLLKNEYSFVQVWLATRPHFKEEIENQLGVISFSLKEITENEQVSFLTTYWTHHSLEEESKLNHFAKIVVEEFRVTLSNCSSILGIPLQTYMLAVVFLLSVLEEKATDFSNWSIVFLFEKFLQALYYKFFRKTGKVILKEDLLIKLLDEACQDFALCYGGIIPEDEAKLLARKSHSFNQKELLDTGIIYKSKETYDFVHQTFAEYLIAKRLAVLCLQKDFSELCKKLLHKIILDGNNMFFLYLFDLKMTEGYPLHRAILNRGITQAQQISPREINLKDSLGRTFLYYAIQYRYHNIVITLLEKEINLDTKDTFLIVALIKKIQHYYDISTSEKSVASEHEIDAFRYWHTTIAKQIFGEKNPWSYSKDLLYSYNCGIEVSFQNWGLVEVIIKSGIQVCSPLTTYSFLLILMKNKAPLKIVLLFLKRDQQNKRLSDGYNSNNSLFPTTYLNIIRYLLQYETKMFKQVIEKYPSEVIDLLNPFNSFTHDTFLLYYLIKVYKDLRYTIFSSDSHNSLLDTFKKGADNFYLIVKLLFENGFVGECIYKGLRWTDFRNLPFSNYPLLMSVDLTASVRQFFLSGQDPELQEIIRQFASESLFTEETILKEALCQILNEIWGFSDGFKMINMFNQVQNAIRRKNFKDVSICLLLAKDLGWLEAILSARNHSVERIKHTAKRLRHKKILNLILKHSDEEKKSKNPLAWFRKSSKRMSSTHFLK